MYQGTSPTVSELPRFSIYASGVTEYYQIVSVKERPT
jgi:hypothetical protein